MYGYIYEITNLLNGKKYIGQHRSETFDENYHGSGKLLIQSINKNGWDDNYSYKILEPVNNIPTICSSEDELNNSEEFYIDYYNCVDSDEYYNLKRGGIGKSASGCKCVYFEGSDKVIIKQIPISEVDTYLSLGWKNGKPKQSQETIDKRRPKLCKPRKDGTAQAISKSLKGKKFTEEHKQALRKPKSKSNWRKGLITVLKNDIQLSIKEEELDDYLNQGFVRGSKKHSEEACKLHSKKARNGIYMSNGSVKIRPQLEDVEKYINDGFHVIGKVSLNKYKEFISNK